MNEHYRRRAVVVRMAEGCAIAVGLTLLLSHPASAQSTTRSGKDIVETQCAPCHRNGLHGAPKIGDKKAWADRASRGLSALTQSALHGIRQMPSHGGNATLTDMDLKRAITYMVNQSGGHWTEPIDKDQTTRVRSGEEIVKRQCFKCHEDGKNGAPRIGDRAAWIPRLSHGLDTTVRSAINGHGGMPARGGLADLTDAELKSAIVYMFNQQPGTASKKQ
jgi:cytochrome c5